MIGELITAGAGLVGSLFGKKKQKTETTIDYVKMAQNAEAAGFNPLTALRNGGSAGFTSTVHHPGLSGVGDAVANLGGTLGAALSKRMDPIEQKRDRVESALLDYQLNKIQADPKNPMMFGAVPTKTGLPLKITHRPELSNSKAPGKFDDARFGKHIVPGDAPTVSSMGWSKSGWHENPNVPDAGVAEQIYGEVLGSVYGLGKVAADALYSGERYYDKVSREPRLPDTDWRMKGARWLDKTLGTQKKPVKGGRVAPPSSW